MTGAGPHLLKITPAEHRVMPWKNGLGTTREIAIDPPDATVTGAGFRWRLSIANVDQSGPFSAFPGVDRTIMVIKGNGMVLTAAGQAARRLDRCFEPFSFSGDIAVDCELIDGPVQDFNLMVNRSLLAARTEVQNLKGTTRRARVGESCIIYLVSGSADIRAGELQECGRAGDTIVVSHLPPDAALELTQQGEALVVAMDLMTVRR